MESREENIPGAADWISWKDVVSAWREERTNKQTNSEVSISQLIRSHGIRFRTKTWGSQSQKATHLPGGQLHQQGQQRPRRSRTKWINHFINAERWALCLLLLFCSMKAPLWGGGFRSSKGSEKILYKWNHINNYNLAAISQTENVKNEHRQTILTFTKVILWWKSKGKTGGKDGVGLCCPMMHMVRKMLLLFSRNTPGQVTWNEWSGSCIRLFHFFKVFFYW